MLLRYRIDFYSELEASVTLDHQQGEQNPLHPEDHLYVETLAFICYTLRQFRNLGDHPSAEGLDLALSMLGPVVVRDTSEEGSDTTLASVTSPMVHAAEKAGLSTQEAYEKYGGLRQLVSRQGEGERGFSGKLEFLEPSPRFRLRKFGFGLGGLLGIGLPQYSVDSVVIFLASLLVREGPTDHYRDSLSGIITEALYRLDFGEITPVNLETSAVEMLDEFWPN